MKLPNLVAVFLSVTIATVLHGLCFAAPPVDSAVGPESVVREIYAAYAWETLPTQPKGKVGLIEESKATLGKYFSKRLIELIQADNECARKTSGICNLDFDPIYASQDPELKDLQISAIDRNGDVVVRFKYPSNGQKIIVKYKMKKISDGWRIADICYQNHQCLVQILSNKN